MTKIEIGPINGVAVTAFVVCTGAIVTAIVHHTAALIAWACISCLSAGLYLTTANSALYN